MKNIKEGQDTTMVGLPCGFGYFPWETVQALLQMKKTMPCMMAVIPRQRVDKARNFLVQQALESGATYLLFIDDDNPPPADTMEHFSQSMSRDDVDIVCAPILSRNANKEGFRDLCMFKKNEVEEKGGINNYTFLKKIDVSSGHLVEVDGCGMGVTMIKRKVLEKLWKEHEGMPFEFGDSTLVYDKKDMNKQRRTMSEDMEFSERATNAGFRIWCDTRVRPVHLGDPKQFIFSDNYTS